jgi:serine protease inhibitor
LDETLSRLDKLNEKFDSDDRVDKLDKKLDKDMERLGKLLEQNSTWFERHMNIIEKNLENTKKYVDAEITSVGAKASKKFSELTLRFLTLVTSRDYFLLLRIGI